MVKSEINQQRKKEHGYKLIPQDQLVPKGGIGIETEKVVEWVMYMATQWPTAQQASVRSYMVINYKMVTHCHVTGKYKIATSYHMTYNKMAAPDHMVRVHKMATAHHVTCNKMAATDHMMQDCKMAAFTM